MNLLPHQRWANETARDSYRPIGMPFYAESHGETYNHDCDTQMWWIYCKGFNGFVSGRVPFSWAKEKCDALNLAVVEFFEKGDMVG